MRLLRVIQVIARCRISVFVVLLWVPQVMSGEQAAARPGPDGKSIFQARCAICHGEEGEGRSAIISIAGPNIQAEHNKGRVLTAIYTGPSHMPVLGYSLSVQQANAVADYVVNHLATIPLTGGKLSDGERLFQIYCAACHRTAVRGGALTFTGVNAPDLTGMSQALIAGAIRWGPGPMPKFPPSVLSNQQLASITDYVQYVQHPPTPGGTPLHYIGPVAEGVVTWIVVFFLIVATTWIEKGGKG